MARYTGPTCKLARREGADLSLKSGVKKLEDKCRLKTTPGGNKRMASRRSDYLDHLREKQKLRRTYGLLERQFRNCYQRADRARGATGTALIQILESRLDNIVYRLGFASTRAHARQMVSHKLVVLDGRPVNIPSCNVSVGQTIALSEKARGLQMVKEATELAQTRPSSEWLDVDYEKMSGVYRELPAPEIVAADVNENLIVEYYSK
ncbi:MAG: 30S ribosomal protein S4 [Gammaproteobacteria bacterium WSBS_2016_MAG_OTU1]